MHGMLVVARAKCIIATSKRICIFHPEGKQTHQDTTTEPKLAAQQHNDAQERRQTVEFHLKIITRLLKIIED